jgi:hypothetical protein
MKRYILPIAATLALSMVAEAQQIPSIGTNVFSQNASKTEKVAKAVTPFTAQVNGKAKKSKSQVPANANNELITSVEGVESAYTRSSVGFAVIYGYTMWNIDDSGAGTITRGNDGNIYFKDVIPGYEEGTYVKGVQEGDKVNLQLPQLLKTQSDGTTDYNYYAMVLKKVETETSVNYIPDDDQSLSFTVGEDGTYTLDIDYTYDVYNRTYPDKILGVYAYAGEAEGWAGSSVMVEKYTPFSDVALTAPEGLETDLWSFTYNGDGFAVNVGFDGDDVWVQGIYPTIHDAWIKGTLKDGKVTFASPQYLGSNGSNFYYFMAVKVDQVYNETYGAYISDYVAQESIVFDYDAEKKVLTTDATNIIAISLSGESMVATAGYIYPQFAYAGSEVKGVPETPGFYMLGGDESYGYFKFCFTLSKFSTEGSFLDTSKLYYKIYVDGEELTFDPEDYVKLSEPMTEIPYSFTDGYDFTQVQGITIATIYTLGWDTIGVQLFYKADDDTILESGILSYDRTTGEVTGVNNINVDKQAVSENYYDLYGRKVTSDTKGLVIKVTNFADGSSKSVKQVIK